MKESEIFVLIALCFIVVAMICFYFGSERGITSMFGAFGFMVLCFIAIQKEKDD